MTHSYPRQIAAAIVWRIKRAYHKWCLRNAIAAHKCKVCIYHASTNSFTVQSNLTGTKYHAFVNARGKIIFEGIVE